MADCFINGQGGSGNSDYEFTFSIDGKFQYPTKVIIPNTVTSLQSNSLQGFYQHSEIKEIEFENVCQITTLPSSCFSQCTNLEKINIPKSITKFSGNAFYGDTLLQAVVFEEDSKDEEKKILMNGASDFQNCKSLTNFEFKTDSKIKIDLSQSSASLFKGCTKIDNDFFSNFINKVVSKTDVGAYMFADCTSLTNVTSPIIGHYLFANCTGLEEAAILPENMMTATYNYVFQECKNLKNVTITNIKGIGTNFFYNCTNLTSITLSEGITTISNNAFRNCSSLTELYLPSTITSFGGNTVFTGCTNLSNLSVGVDWNCVADFSVLDLSIESIVGIFNNLKDLTSETTKTLTFGANNLLKTTLEQRAIATNKNWTLA